MHDAPGSLPALFGLRDIELPLLKLGSWNLEPAAIWANDLNGLLVAAEELPTRLRSTPHAERVGRLLLHLIHTRFLRPQAPAYAALTSIGFGSGGLVSTFGTLAAVM